MWVRELRAALPSTARVPRRRDRIPVGRRDHRGRPRSGCGGSWSRRVCGARPTVPRRARRGGPGCSGCVAGPLADGQVGVGPGQHRAPGGEQHCYQRVAPSTSVPRITKNSQLAGRPAMQFRTLGGRGRLGQADGGRLAAHRSLRCSRRLGGRLEHRSFDAFVTDRWPDVTPLRPAPPPHADMLAWVSPMTTREN